MPKLVCIVGALFGLLAVPATAQAQAPALAGRGLPISSRDRIYTGDQTSNTVSVIDPNNNTVLGTISFGAARLSNNLNPQNIQSVNSHGLGFSRDGKYIVSLSTLSNTVNVIKTADNSIVTTAYVDRGPHEAFFAPDNRTIWIGTRGVSSIQILDGMNGTALSRIMTGKGPSKVLFSPDGTTAYVNHIMEPLIAVIDVQSQKVMYNITGLANVFSSDMMLSADGNRLWAAHKMSGQVSVIDVTARKVVSVLETGPETNHPNFAVVNGTTYGWVSVGSMNATRVYYQPSPDSEPIHIKDVRQSGIQPHGLWPSADNTRMYVVNEHSDTVDVIDTSSMEVVDTFSVGQEGQALIYVSNAIPSDDAASQEASRERLGKQGLGMRVESLLLPVEGNNTKAIANAQVTIRQTSGLDMFQVIGRNLLLNGTYTVSAKCKACDQKSPRTPLVSFNASMPTASGCGSAPQVLAFFRFFDTYDLKTIVVREGME
ncbi:hypothetical protein CKM354_001137500 [Cercospora kikuchii]|uniref:40-residue YVTN family beta-propeller repeat-containing protein n=1 Tax=Cercospora kikuchii TaxID=84275 RepID=A0A9P3CSV5_9PEZI|nr:uncharacterized protein CKM354_001137500 [Cercospora kikuchii]GIZ48308.1 hypothetical protein CKM354_001137500 [Cercospora kikuchii]